MIEKIAAAKSSQLRRKFGLMSVEPVLQLMSLVFIFVREHPFNLKGGGEGLWFFSESKYFFRFAAQHKIIFFYKNNNF